MLRSTSSVHKSSIRQSRVIQSQVCLAFFVQAPESDFVPECTVHVMMSLLRPLAATLQAVAMWASMVASPASAQNSATIFGTGEHMLEYNTHINFEINVCTYFERIPLLFSLLGFGKDHTFLREGKRPLA